ncbi:MAG: recombinase [Psychroflexus sp.]
MADKKQDLNNLFETYFKDESWENISAQVDLLAKLVHFFRPNNIDKEKPVSLTVLIHLLEENNEYRKQFAKYINVLLKKKSFYSLISDAGIPEESDFFFEIKEKLFAKILPKQPEEDRLEYILNQVFYKADDTDWVELIDPNEFRILFELLEFKPIQASVEIGSPLSEVLFALEIMASRICGNVLETKVMRMTPEYNNLDSPFLAFQKELSQIEERILNDDSHFIDPEDEDFKHLNVLLQQCKDYVSLAFKNSRKFGISLRVNQDLMRIKRQLLRIEVSLPFLSGKDKNDLRENTINLGKCLIKHNCYKNNLSKFFDEGTRLLSYEITEQTAKTGQHYITNNKKGYFKMLLTSGGGGLIVGLLCVSKVLISKLELSSFGEAFFYSMNYSIGFVILYLLGFTLATKQPAMTASTLVSALESGMKKGGSRRTKHQVFAKLFSEVFRSQFVAFIGNIIMAFPVAMLVVYLVDINLDYNIPEAKWDKLIHKLNPVTSLAILHAAIAGVFLFISGIIAGGISNRNKFNNVYSRIGRHPYLKRKFSKKFALKLAKFVENKWAGIMSNFWFGVFMGSTASIGVFFGLNLDIRHIAFSSGNFALGMYGSGFSLTTEMIIWSLLGIFLIGLMNFSVSFGLSIALAFRSRRIPFTEFSAITLSVLTYFSNTPSVFIWPPKHQPTEDIETKDEKKS